MSIYPSGEKKKLQDKPVGADDDQVLFHTDANIISDKIEELEASDGGEVIDVAFEEEIDFKGRTKSYHQQIGDNIIRPKSVQTSTSGEHSHKLVYDGDGVNSVTATGFGVIDGTPDNELGKRNTFFIIYDADNSGSVKDNSICNIKVQLLDGNATNPLLGLAYVSNTVKDRIILMFDQDVLATDIAKFTPSGGKNVTSIIGSGTDTLELVLDASYALGDSIDISITSDAVSGTFGGLFYLGVANETVHNLIVDPEIIYEFNNNVDDSSGNALNGTVVGGTGVTYDTFEPYTGTHNILFPSSLGGVESGAFDSAANNQTTFVAWVKRVSSDNSRPIFYLSPNIFIRTNDIGGDQGIELVCNGTFEGTALLSITSFDRVVLIQDFSLGITNVSYQVYINDILDIDISGIDMTSKNMGQGFVDIGSTTSQSVCFGGLFGKVQLFDTRLTEAQIFSLT